MIGPRLLDGNASARDGPHPLPPLPCVGEGEQNTTHRTAALAVRRLQGRQCDVRNLYPLSRARERGQGVRAVCGTCAQRENARAVATLVPKGVAVFDDEAKRALLEWYQAGHRDLPWRH